MLVVEPTNLRFEDGSQVGGGLDEHLLERISLLENNLSRVIDKLEKTLDLMLKQAQTSHVSHTLLDALINTLAETGALNRQLFRSKWSGRGLPEEDGPAGATALAAAIFGCYAGEETEAFSRAVAEGCALVEAGEAAAAARALEKAARLDAGNAPLNRLTGLALLAAGRPAKALPRLRRAARDEPDGLRMAALLGLALAETGDAEGAKSALRSASDGGASSFALHLALGQLAAGRGDWREARAQFKLALARRARAEVLYLLGRAHHRLGQPRAAAACLRRAVEAEAAYAEAWALLGRVLAGRGDEAAAREARSHARRAARSAGAKGNGRGGLMGAGRGRGAAGAADARRLVTGGDPRLLRALADELLADALPR